MLVVGNSMSRKGSMQPLTAAGRGLSSRDVLERLSEENVLPPGGATSTSAIRDVEGSSTSFSSK